MKISIDSSIYIRILENHFHHNLFAENLEQEPPETEKETRPIGSQFGEASSRLLSARKSLLRRRYKHDN